MFIAQNLLLPYNLIKNKKSTEMHSLLLDIHTSVEDTSPAMKSSKPFRRRLLLLEEILGIWKGLLTGETVKRERTGIRSLIVTRIWKRLCVQTGDTVKRY